jgi:TRAP transporter TAXI family solute receptor
MKRVLKTILLAWFMVGFISAAAFAKEEIQYLRIGGASIGGTWLLYAGKLVQILEKEFPKTKASAVVSAGAVANCVQVQAKKMDFAFTHTVVAGMAFKGEEPFTQVIPNIRHVMSLFPAMIHFIVSNKCPELKEFPDLYKKPYRMSVQHQGHWVHVNRMLAFYNMSLEEFQKKGGRISYLGIGAMANNMQDGNLDIATIMDPYRSAGLLQIDQNPGFHFMAVKTEPYTAKYPGWIKCKVPKGTYKSVKEDYYGLGTLNSLITHKDTPDDFVYKVLEAITKNLDVMNEVIPEGLKVKPQDMPVGYAIPLHPGAKKFYEERGLLKK